ncbi:type 2 periplasmic-binding domain-containing protein [Kordiimonas aestuarii]|uniref:transporter substrate-binding domain-containing protein n=1 Tax=Kordiimonas aestuarii TaxID=1005925 RepID=UPI0021D1DAB6|nr:transporter substrate-binding domain-containing protein [Kordiimonas aestuarii]
MRVGQSDSIAYSRVFAAILTEAGISAEFVAAPHGRKRRMFLDGVIAIDCCASPIWRQAPGEAEVQLFSDAFHHSPEHYVFRKGQVVDIAKPEVLRTLRVAKVRGFNYQDERFFGETIAVRDMEDVLDMLVAGRADVGMINRQDFYRRMRLKPRPLELGKAHFIADLRLRVHKDHAALLPKINAAITHLRQAGRIAEILKDAEEQRMVKEADEPVSLKVGQSDSVGFQAAWRAILDEANISSSFVSVPPERKRRLFIEGGILLDCCAASVWRDRPAEIEVQRWSETFYLTREQYVFPNGKAKPIDVPEDLKLLRVATVGGFEYQDRAFFGVEVPGRNIEDVLKLLLAGRADVGIISNVDFIALTQWTPNSFELGDVRIRAQQKVRVHRSVAHLLPRINAAITRLNSDGRLITLLERQTPVALDPLATKE